MKANWQLSLCWFNFQLFEKANKVVVSNVPKYYYLQRSNGIMLSKSTGMWIDYYELSLERYKYIENKYPEMVENDISLLTFYNRTLQFLTRLNLIPLRTTHQFFYRKKKTIKRITIKFI